jgi:hypothetical protein
MTSADISFPPTPGRGEGVFQYTCAISAEHWSFAKVDIKAIKNTIWNKFSAFSVQHKSFEGRYIGHEES